MAQKITIQHLRSTQNVKTIVLNLVFNLFFAIFFSLSSTLGLNMFGGMEIRGVFKLVTTLFYFEKRQIRFLIKNFLLRYKVGFILNFARSLNTLH